MLLFLILYVYQEAGFLVVAPQSTSEIFRFEECLKVREMLVCKQQSKMTIENELNEGELDIKTIADEFAIGVLIRTMTSSNKHSNEIPS